MQLENTQEAFESFAKYVVQQARTNLTKGKKNVSKNLYNSLGYKLSVYPNSMRLKFTGMDLGTYGSFVDQGVRGAGGTRKTTSQYNRRNNKGKIWKQKGGKSPFSFKIGRKPSVKHFESWAKSKGLSPYAVREAVFRQGIKPSYFFTKPFERAFKGLPDEVVEAFGLDLNEFLDFTKYGK